jgi:magnesium chelatase subunit D
MPTGGKTPLAAGLSLGYEILKVRKVKDPDMVPVSVLVSDCRANVSLYGGDPVEEAKELGRKLKAEGINVLIIDSEKDFIELGLAKELAEAIGAKYYKLSDLESLEIEGAVRTYLGGG